MDAKDFELIRALMDEDVFFTKRPFAFIAKTLGWSEREVMGRLKCLQLEGVLGKIRANILSPSDVTKASASAIVCWKVEEGMELGTALALASHSSVKKCLAVMPAKGFDYNLCTFVQAEAKEALRIAVEELSCGTGIGEYMVFETIEELKPVGVSLHKSPEREAANWLMAS